MPRHDQGPRNIVLVGFMGAGKSTVGRLLANALGMSLCDTDAQIVERTGLGIPQIFAEFGEPFFRRVEATVVQHAARASGQVIATGGGALANAESLCSLLQGNLVVWLTGPVDMLLVRARRQGDRPLLDRSAQSGLKKLYAARVEQYAEAHLMVGADAPAESIAETIQHYWELACQGGVAVRSVPVRCGNQSYAVHVGSNLLQRCHEFVTSSPARVLLITDSNVAPLYSGRVLASLGQGGWDVERVVFPAGEEHKTLQTLESLYEACVRAGLSRDGLVVALGGGVTGDVAGLVAATYMRGVPLVQIPTTLLAQVDASVGGKVAVNLRQGKNLVGAFYQPQAVIADTTVLCSLPQRELLSGLAEVIKHGVMADESLLRFTEEHLPDILTRDPEVLGHCVYCSCVIKGAVVGIDEKETGKREVLNFGHTVAHALETVTAYRTYTHGAAVAVGMVTAGRLSCLAGGWSAADLDRLLAVLRRAGLPVSAPRVSIDELLAAVERDKKVRAQQLRMVLSPRLGSAEAGVPVTRQQLREALQWQQKL
ncbi:MAG: 3-dehydroquinate synthase [Limnochordia bacterium]|jgi:shikimate kinase/3-dehydroquinate synthase